MHDHLERLLRRWRAILVDDVASAINAGDLPEGTDPETVALILDAIASAVTPGRTLYHNQLTGKRARHAMRVALGVPDA